MQTKQIVHSMLAVAGGNCVQHHDEAVAVTSQLGCWQLVPTASEWNFPSARASHKKFLIAGIVCEKETAFLHHL